MPEIRLESICKDFDGHVAADDLSLTIGDGEYLCILGPTGAGKTTCMRMICGLTRPDSGRVYFDGEDVTDMDVDLRNSTMLSQSYSLFPHMSVYNNVIFAPRIKEWPEESAKQIVRSMLNMVHLEQKADWKPAQLSGGQQQRIALARALASGSKVLLLDEPLRALDARLRINLRKELRSLAKEMGLTCIHVTHDQDEALEMADRIAVIRRGRIIQVGEPRDVFENPATPFVANFVGRSNVVTGRLTASDGDHAEVTVPGGWVLRTRPTGIPVGTDVVVTVKVGSTKVSHATDEDIPNRMCTGTIERILYEGATITVDVSVDGMGTLSAKLPNRKYDDYKAGETVDIQWVPSKASVFTMPEQGLEEEMRLD
ncbi:MAG: ABC transporter ATP-binding protein [Candidatus Methanomethylophilaceae archaeon]|nr:ABC transporter ATP-binding protein [Candidatus Methanomethylophilaceae archaeon]